MLGTDFPYPDWYPKGKTVVQVDERAGHIGRRTPVDLGVVGDTRLTIAALLAQVAAKDDRSHLEDATAKYADTGMSTVWLSRFVTMHGSRRLLGSYNLGSMANAMPQGLGAQALDRSRQVVAFCGDGGLTMLLGDLLTAVAYELPLRVIVFNNGRLGMVKLEQEQGGLPEFGTTLHNPNLAAVAVAMGLHGIHVEAPEDLDSSVQQALSHSGPVLLDVVTNPDEIALPPKLRSADAWGFAIAKLTETLDSRRK